jgi:hypothetical protein
MTRTATPRGCFPTLRWVISGPFRWVGRSRRRIGGAAAVVLAVIAGPPLWWATQLAGLPDTGDPFDVAAFRAFSIPDDRNAFVLYRRAADLLEPGAHYLKTSGSRVDPFTPWSKADPGLRRWAEKNREALAVYRRGAERPDALDPAVGFDREGWKTYRALGPLHLLALLEASRREEQGDMVGAWGWYRALLRTARHVGMRGSVSRRNEILRWHRHVRDRLTAWAADPRTTAEAIRRAVDDVTACEALAPSELDSIKRSYLDVTWLLDRPANPGREVPLARFRRFWHPEYQLEPEQIQALWDAWRFWRGEPERSRRVVRLVTANWLAYHGLPPGDRPKPDPRVASLDLYPFGPDAAAGARSLPPEAFDRWFDTAYDAQKVLVFLDGTQARIMERANHGEILVLLGSELYRRDHGTDPPTPEALVGPYLKSLPAEPAEGARDRAVPKPGKPVGLMSPE